MNKPNLLKYILIGIIAAAAFLCGFSLFDMLIHPERTFADGFKSVFQWVLAVTFGCSCAYSSWKKDHKDDKKE